MRMDSDDLLSRLTGDKVLYRLSDSESECQSNVWNSQLSPISSQPSLAELQRPPSDLAAATLGSPDSNCQDQHQARSWETSVTSVAASASIGSAAWAEVSGLAEQVNEGSHGTGSLKAESELLDPWDAPFDSSLPVSRPAAQSPDPTDFLQDFLEELGTSVQPQRVCAGEAQRPHSAMAALESRHQQAVSFGAHSPALPVCCSPSQQMALHSSFAGPVHELGQPSLGWPNQIGQVAQQAHIPSSAFFGSQQPQASDLGSLPNPNQPAGSQHNTLQPPGLMQASQGLQVPLHVQHWLAMLANDSQQGTEGQTALKQHATNTNTSPHVSSAGAAKAATEMREDVRQLRAELSEVKSKFAETQAALAQTQQQLAAQQQSQIESPGRSCSPEPFNSVSPQKLRALQETMQDLHAEVAELRGIVHQKNAELDSLHRVQEQKGSEVQAALRQVASEAGRASKSSSDLISCREACKALEEQLTQAHCRMQNMAGEQHLLDGVIAKGRQENASLRSSCLRLQDELNSLRTQCQDAVSGARGAERTAVAREAEADALCKENTALKQQLHSLEQDCGRRRGAFYAVTAELAEVKDAFRQLQKAQAASQMPLGRSLQAHYQSTDPQQQGPRPAAATADYINYKGPPQEVKGTQKRQAWPAASADEQANSGPHLIRASRQVNKAVEPYKMSTPWGQPEPVSRHPHADACPPAEATSRGAACGPGHWSSDPACHKYGSSNATEPDVDQGDRAQWGGTQGVRAHSHYKATMSARDASDDGAWQPPGHRAGPSDSSPRPNSNRGPPCEADTHPHRKHSNLAPADNAARPSTAASRLISQQSSLQGSDRDRAESQQWPRSSQGYNRADPPARDLAARDCDEPPAGLSSSRRSEQHEHQHKLQTPSAKHGTSKGLHSGKILSDNVPAARPYATEQSLKATIQASQNLEDQLMKLNQEKAELEAEYARMPSHAGRNLKERKRKTDIEYRFETIDHDVNSLRLQLKRLGLK